ncbi:MAG: hypothetical protein Kow00117_11090 [Phototrophicales bacterium]
MDMDCAAWITGVTRGADIKMAWDVYAVALGASWNLRVVVYPACHAPSDI